jgi:dihydroxyacetone kinase-like protein
MGDALDTAAARAWLDAFARAIEERRDELTELDRRSGDGDFGGNVTAALGRARAAAAEADSVGAVFAALSRAFLAAGGTSGPLFGMWFRELGRAAAGESAGVEELAAGAAAGLEAVQRLGGAQVGDKTMVDAMAPAAEVLARGETLADAARAARAGADSTAELVARRGRASYVGEVARGVHDPGAVTVALFFETAPD